MHRTTIVILIAMCCCTVLQVSAETLLQTDKNPTSLENVPIESADEESGAHVRQKRTLLLKKKLIGAGLLGFGLGVAKGYKAGYHSTPEVRHVYLSPPPSAVKYVEYVEKPIFVERIVERPATVFRPVHVEYEPPRFQKDSSAPYGSW